MAVRWFSSPRVPFANVRPRPTRLAAITSTRSGVGTVTLPPLIPTFVQDDERLQLLGGPFIVIRSASDRDRHSQRERLARVMGEDLSSTRV